MTGEWQTIKFIKRNSWSTWKGDAMRKAQGATEYLIILAVVVVIALILIGVLGGIPGIGGGAGGRTSSAYWGAQDIAISQAAVSAAGNDQVVLKNNLKSSVYVNYTWVNGVNVATGQSLGPGGAVTLTGAIGSCTSGQAYSFPVNITYTNADSGLVYTITGDGNNLQGTCAS